MTKGKGRARFVAQCRAMLYNMSTRKGAVEGLQWAHMRDAVHAQSGWSTTALAFERLAWRATKTDLSWSEWLRAKRAEQEKRGSKFLGPAR